jgi:hypothetical protein
MGDRLAQRADEHVPATAIASLLGAIAAPGS